jgi:hypothetical protein
LIVAVAAYRAVEALAQRGVTLDLRLLAGLLLLRRP